MTIQLFAGRFVLLVNFPLVTEQPSRIGETLHLVAARFDTLIGSIVLVHVLASTKSALKGSTNTSGVYTYFHSHGLRKIGGACAHS